MKSSASAQTRRQKVEEREQAILDSARHVFFHKGYEGARMSEIAAGAQIAEGTIYIYYQNKAALMRAIVADFWQSLTTDAWKHVEGINSAKDALTAFAAFHISSLIEQSDMINLTVSLRSTSVDVGTTVDEIKSYVSVFDTLYQRGVDRGELKPPPVLWIVRDVFFGTMDYSARTLLLHNDMDVKPVVDNLINGIWAQFGSPDQNRDTLNDESAAPLINRLEQAVVDLEKLSVDGVGKVNL